MNQNPLIPLKENLTDLVNWLEDANTNINKLEILDTSFEDLSDIFSKFSKVLGGIFKVYNISQEIFFKRFLKGLASKINSGTPMDYISKQKLDDYLSKTKNVEFVYTTIRKSLTANSLTCTELLAIIVGEILQKQLEMTPENIVIIDALHVLNDYDLNNFYKIYKYLSSNEKNKERLDILYKEINPNINLSLNKLIYNQLLIQENAKLGITHSTIGTVYGNIITDNEKYIISYSISEKLYNLLEETKVQLLFLE